MEETGYGRCWTTDQDNDWFQAVVDLATRYLLAVPLRHKTTCTEPIDIFACHGVPEEIIHNNGGNFTAVNAQGDGYTADQNNNWLPYVLYVTRTTAHEAHHFSSCLVIDQTHLSATFVEDPVENLPQAVDQYLRQLRAWMELAQRRVITRLNWRVR
jgi:hypothetical protein